MLELGQSTPEVCYLPFKSNENKLKKCSGLVTASSLVKTFWVMQYKEVQKIFPYNMDFMGIKEMQICTYISKIKYKLT
jgi:hypothetical protein